MYRFAFLARYVAFAAAMTMAGGGHAMSAMSEQELADVSGAGIALGFEDIRVRAGSTTYLEYSGTTGTANFQAANARYYGMSLSGDTPVTSWGGICGSGISGLGCPIGDKIANFAPFDNPYILRAFDYNRIKMNGASETSTVLELLGPSQHTSGRLASWAELDVGNGTALHQGQMIMGNSTLTSDDGSPGLGNNAKIRIVKHTDPLDPTVGFIWENHYQGDFRYSVAQTFLSPDAKGAIPFFQDTEGFYALNIETYFPLGQMFYQSLVLDDAGGGNFSIALSQIPDNSAVYSDFYSLAVADSETAGYVRSGRPDRYYETHGFFRVGTSGTTNNTGSLGAAGTKTNDTSDGIFFVASPSSTFSAFADRPDINPGGNPGTRPSYTYNNLSQVNIGDIAINGLLIHNMKITTCSAGVTSPC